MTACTILAQNASPVPSSLQPPPKPEPALTMEQLSQEQGNNDRSTRGSASTMIKGLRQPGPHGMQQAEQSKASGMIIQRQSGPFEEGNSGPCQMHEARGRRSPAKCSSDLSLHRPPLTIAHQARLYHPQLEDIVSGENALPACIDLDEPGGRAAALGSHDSAQLPAQQLRRQVFRTASAIVPGRFAPRVPDLDTSTDAIEIQGFGSTTPLSIASSSVDKASSTGPAGPTSQSLSKAMTMNMTHPVAPTSQSNSIGSRARSSVASSVRLDGMASGSRKSSGLQARTNEIC